MQTKEFSQPVIQTNTAARASPKPVVQSLTWYGRRELFKEFMCVRRKKKGKSKVLSHGFCLRDSEAEQRASNFLHIYCSNVNSYSSAFESNRQHPPDRAMDLPFFFRLLKMSFCPHQARVSCNGFRVTLRLCLF